MKVLGIACLILCLTIAVHAQDSLNVSLISHVHDGWESAQDVVVTGDYAYLATGLSGLHILDISDPANPDIIGTCDTPGDAVRLAVQGNYAYVACSSAGTMIIDISNPHAPVEVGACVMNTHTDVAVQGDYVYVAVPSGPRLYVFNISDPTSPQFMGQTTTAPVEWVDVEGDYAYVAGNNEAAVIDISDPTLPVEITSCTIPGGAEGLDYEDGYVYVTTNDRLVVVEVDLPQLEVAGHCLLTGLLAHGLKVAGSYAYLAQGTYGLGVFNISDPAHPTHVSSTVVDSYGYGIDVVDQAVYLGSDGELVSYTVIDPWFPSVQSIYLSLGLINDISLFNDIACLATSQDRLFLFDVQIPENPVYLGKSELMFESPRKICRQGNLVYSVTSNYLYIHDITNPCLPQLIGWLSINDCLGFSIVVSGDYAYVGDFEGGIHVVDISDPEAPVERGSCDGPMESLGIALRGHYAVVASYAGGLRVFDISDPDNPSNAALYFIDAHAYDVGIDGEYAFVATGTPSVLVFDISDPMTPTVVSEYMTDYSARTIDLIDDHLFVTTTENLHVFDVSDPENPVETGYYTFGYNSSSSLAAAVETAWVVRDYQFLGMDVSLAAPPSPVVVTLSAVTPLFVPQGGSFAYDVTLTSHLPAPYNVDIWTLVLLPEGSPYGPIWRINNLPFTPSTVIHVDNVGQFVPGDAPVGEYSFRMQAGIFPQYIVSGDEFTFEVVESAATNDMDWNGLGYEDVFGRFASPVTTGQHLTGRFILCPIMPNPFNESATVTVQLGETSDLTVVVFNTLGRQVAELASHRVTAGRHAFAFDGSALASGIYFVQARVPGKLNAMQKVVLLK